MNPSSATKKNCENVMMLPAPGSSLQRRKKTFNAKLRGLGRDFRSHELSGKLAATQPDDKFQEDDIGTAAQEHQQDG